MHHFVTRNPKLTDGSLFELAHNILDELANYDIQNTHQYTKIYYLSEPLIILHNTSLTNNSTCEIHTTLNSKLVAQIYSDKPLEFDQIWLPVLGLLITAGVLIGLVIKTSGKKY